MDIQKSIKKYKEILNNEDVQHVYFTLMKYVAELKSDFSKIYKTGYISYGYLDYTYFSFSDEYFKEKDLRFGIVLNHKEMRFELWLMGKNEKLQNEYWEILKNSKWNVGKVKRPKFSVFEIVIEDNIDFTNKENMTKNILNNSKTLKEEVEVYLEKHI